MNYANPWKRLGAYVIDSLILSAALQVIFSAIMPLYMSLNAGLLKEFTEAAEKTDGPSMELLMQMFYSFLPFIIAATILTLIAYWLYFALMESSANQATLGKKVFNIIVTDEQGQRIDFKKASIRFAIKYLCSFIFLLFLPIFFTQKKQTIHDLSVHTIVIDRP